MIINGNTLELSNDIKSLEKAVKQNYDKNDIINLLTSIEIKYAKLINEIQNEIDIQELHKQIIVPIDKFSIWYFKNKENHIILDSTHNTLKLIKELIFNHAQPFIYIKEKELAETHKMYGVSKIKNITPSGFSSLEGFKIFSELLNDYKDKPNHIANFSFIYYAMVSFNLIYFNTKEFIEYLSRKHDIDLVKIDSRQSDTKSNSRFIHFEKVKTKYLK